jgi:endonuclease YncB( thermonuclease family)
LRPVDGRDPAEAPATLHPTGRDLGVSGSMIRRTEIDEAIAMLKMRLAVAALCLAAAIGSAKAKTSEYGGVAKIIDGDTVQISGVKLHLRGIDAPQIDQLCLDQAGARWKCGIAARQYLKARAGSRWWKCKAVRKDRYGRLLADCRVDGDDIAREMVQNGWALASTTGSASYVSTEAEGGGSGAGGWWVAFVSPRDWRKRNGHAKILGNATARAQSSAQLLTSAFGASPPSPECAIKGNVNWGGKCIFHKPGGHWYKRITMEARYGDRWFCTATEAVASGCRKTRR